MAWKIGVLTQAVSIIKKKKDSCVDLAANRVGKWSWKRKTSPRTDRKIVQMALKGKWLLKDQWLI